MENEVKTIEATVSLPKEAKELADGLEKAAIKIATALKDGVQVAADAPVLLDALMNDIVPAIKGAQSVKEELKALPVETGFVAAKMLQGIIKGL